MGTGVGAAEALATADGAAEAAADGALEAGAADGESWPEMLPVVHAAMTGASATAGPSRAIASSSWRRETCRSTM